ncbi:MAG: FliG C-terminal domain-containing protein [Bdellovibrionota bacterium]
MNKDKLRTFNGPAILISMLRELDPVTRQRMTKKLASASPIFAKLYEHCEFLYADIFRLDDKSIQNLLTSFSEKEWIIAWKLSSEKVRQKLLTNMSERRQKEFMQSLKAFPKTHKKQVIKVQIKIAKKCLDCLRSGHYKLHSKRLLG